MVVFVAGLMPLQGGPAGLRLVTVESSLRRAAETV
jgi:hypothetical protein